MALTFADTHNMMAFLTKSDASEGFEQIINFSNASMIRYALTINPTIYVSCIKKFWSSVLIKKTNDVVRLQALIDRRKVIITEDTVRQALQLDDAESIDCLPNEEIFAELARIGYEKPSTNAKRTAWNEFSSSMASAVIGLATGRKFNFSKYIFDNLVKNVDSSSKFYMVGKGFPGVDSPLFEGMLVPQQVNNDVVDDVANVVADASEPTPPSPPPLQQELIPSTSQVAPTPPLSPYQSPIAPPSSPPQQQPSQPSHTTDISMDLLNTLLETSDTVIDDQEDASKQGGIAEIDADKDVTLEEVAAEVPKDADVRGRQEESHVQVYHLDSEHGQKVLSIKDDEIEPAELTEVIEVVTTAKLMTEVVTTVATTITAAPSAARRKKGLVIRDPEEIDTPSVIMHFEPKSKDKGKGILVEEPTPLKKQALIEQDEAYAKELEVELNANINWNEVIEQKLDEELEELKTHLQIIPNDEDDVYTEATPLALKVPVVNYQIHTEHNKPYYKIIRADGTHQLYLSFISLLRNFEREDLEMLWKIVQARFSSLEPKNFSDDFLLNTLKIMFKIPDVKAIIWKSQSGIYGLAKVKSWKLLESCGVHIITFTTTQMILLVKRRYHLTRFTLDQMLNNVRLEVEEESEVSLELLRFVRRQQQEGYRLE
nr:hypothetical protein [Tanacetum cinerariifolium]